MKFFFFFLLMPFALLGQQQASFLYDIEDTVSMQTITVRCAANEAYISTLELESGWDFSFTPYFSKYRRDGERSFRKLIEEEKPQAIQTFSDNAFMVFGNQFLISADKFYTDTLQSAKVYAFDSTGEKQWEVNLFQEGFLSTSGVFLPLAEDTILHAMVKVGETEQDSQFLSIQKIDLQGNIIFAKNILLPNTNNFEYIRMTDAALLNGSALWNLNYGLAGSGNTSQLLVQTSLDAELIQFEINSPFGIMSNTDNSDTISYTEVIPQTNYLVYCTKSTDADNLDSYNWEKCLGEDINLGYYSISGQQSDDFGNVYLFGYHTSTNLQAHYGFLHKMNPDGTIAWQRDIGFGNVGAGYTDFWSMDFFEDRSIALAGVHRSNGDNNLWLLFLDENGCYLADCGDTIIIEEYFVQNIEIAKTSDFIVYPNPANDNIWIGNEFSEKALEVRIYDMVGKLLISKHGHPAQEALDIRDLPEGIFLLEAISEEGRRSISTFIRQF